MSEFINCAGVLGEATLQDKLHKSHIADILGTKMGSHINCYPGTPGRGCFDVAFFVSLTCSKYKSGNGHLSFKEALEHFVEHMQGTCAGITKHAVIITDNWDPNVFVAKVDNIKRVQEAGACVEIYLLADGKPTRIHW